MSEEVVSLSSPESAKAKGRRYLIEGRLDLKHVSDRLIVANCRGDDGDVYAVGYDFEVGDWRCTCPARGRCAHIVAIALVVEKPT
jgi:uncharacterized Zn finger protein